MSRKELAGSVFILGFEGKDAENVKKIFSDFLPAGWILFRRNICSREQVRDLLEEINKLYSSRIPPLLSVDQEGGRVNRLIEEYPPARELAGVFEEDISEFEKIVGEMARDVKDYGFNLNFAPVLDVLVVENEVIGDRAFGSNPEKVLAPARKWIEIFRDSGVESCGKHFPGHGGVRGDSHRSLPRDSVSREEWERIYLSPFKENFSLLNFLMIAHIIFDFLDPYLPTSLSPQTGKLLSEFGYSGFQVTDDLFMGAIKDNFSPSEIVNLLVSSHVDFWIVAEDTDYIEAIYSSLYDIIWRSDVRAWLEWREKRIERFWKKLYKRFPSGSQ